MGRTLQSLACTRRGFIFLFVFENFFFPHPYPLALTVNKFPTVFIFYHARSTNFEEKIEGPEQAVRRWTNMLQWIVQRPLGYWVNN